MDTIRILEQGPVLSPLLTRCLPHRLRNRVRLSFAASGPPPVAQTDLVVVAPDWEAGPLPPLSCRVLLTPGSMTEAAEAISARWTVSYGGSPRDSLTFSSILDHTILLALQREIVTLRGLRLERQEFSLPFSGRVPPLTLLGCAGTCLLLDVPPAGIRIPQDGVR